MNYYINNGELEDVNQQQVLEKGIVTVKRHLYQARNQDYNEPATGGKKKVKKNWFIVCHLFYKILFLFIYIVSVTGIIQQ